MASDPLWESTDFVLQAAVARDVLEVIIHLPLSTFPPVILTTLPPISVNSPPYV